VLLSCSKISGVFSTMCYFANIEDKLFGKVAKLSGRRAGLIGGART
jgi:hypothetical protein